MRQKNSHQLDYWWDLKERLLAKYGSKGSGEPAQRMIDPSDLQLSGTQNSDLA